MPNFFIFDAFTLLIREKTVANYALLRCKTFSLKIWVCKIFDKFHVWASPRHIFSFSQVSSLSPCNRTHKKNKFAKAVCGKRHGWCHELEAKMGVGGCEWGCHR